VLSPVDDVQSMKQDLLFCANGRVDSSGEEKLAHEQQSSLLWDQAFLQTGGYVRGSEI
jgi:hypothetical protein